MGFRDGEEKMFEKLRLYYSNKYGRKMSIASTMRLLVQEKYQTLAGLPPVPDSENLKEFVRLTIKPLS